MKSLRPRPGQTPRLALLGVVCSAVACLALALPALALSTQYGGQLYYAGGDVTVDVLYANTAYGEVLRLWTGSEAIDVAYSGQVGSHVTLTQQQLANLGIGLGDELHFGIHVLNTSQDFLVGPGSRNGDGLDHAYVRTGSHNVFVGFEDLYGGGDRDYNDTVFRFSGVTATAPHVGFTPAVTPAPSPTSSAPEPATLFLLLTGIGALGIAYRKR